MDECERGSSVSCGMMMDENVVFECDGVVMSG